MSLNERFQSISRVVLHSLNQDAASIKVTVTGGGGCGADERSWADKEIDRLAATLQEKRAKALAYLGEKWILHPVHNKQKLDIGLNTLGKHA